MSTSYGPPVPAGSAEEPPGSFWTPPDGPGGDGGAGNEPGGPVRRPRHRRGLAVAAAGVALVLAALGMAWALHSAGATRRSAGPGTSGVAALVGPGLVNIVSTLGYQDATAAGTGLVLTPSGEVLTNNHVIEGATSIQATDVGNGRTYQAAVVGYDRAGDLAVLQLRGASGLRTVSLGSSAKVTVGESVTALGNAGGTGGTPAVAAGRVTGLDESIIATDEARRTSERLTGLISTDAALQPGDSGGPLVNSAGQVIGLDTAASAGFRFQSGTAQGFAIPIGRAASVAGQIEAGRSSAAIHIGATGFLGVQVALYGAPGSPSGTATVVVGVMPGTPAATAGLAVGDVLTSVNGHAVSSPSDLTALLEAHHPGDKISISWQDLAGRARSATVTLANGPAG